MKLHLLFWTSALALMTQMASAQGTFVYDQQSADESELPEGAVAIEGTQPMGQSFTPSLSAVGFIRLMLFDGIPGNSLGGTLIVNLRSTSITGPIIGTSDPVFLPDGFSAVFTNFFFSVPVTVTPNTKYYFQPVVQSGDNQLVGSHLPFSDYPGGNSYSSGQAGIFDDLWFREGIIVVPEPATWALMALGVGALAWRKRSPS